MNKLDDWKRWWAETANERPEYSGDKTGWRVASPRRNPEDEDWWFTNGYKFYQKWIDWRKANSHLIIPTTKDDQLTIELEMNPVVNGITVKMFLDRVMLDTTTGEYILIDLKTGKTTPTSALQLGFYSYGLRKIYDIHVSTGYYWMARKGQLSPAFDLAGYTDDKIESLVGMFDKARKENVFLPNFDHCRMCGLTMHCEWFYQPKEIEIDE
jgi:hypothetical protein